MIAADSTTPRTDLLAFILRATNRGDLDAAAMGYRSLLTLQLRPEDVLALASLEERSGQIAMAINTLDYWIGASSDPDPRWVAKRQLLATQLPDPAETLERPLRAARNDARPELALQVNRTEAQLGQIVTLRGEIPPGQDMAIFWIDGEQLAFLWAAPGHTLSDGRLAKDYVVTDPSGFKLGDVTLLALSGPGLATLADPELEVDLMACQRGDLSQLQALQDASAMLTEWIAQADVQAQVLTWKQIEGMP